MSLKKDVIGADVQINSNEAQKSLVDLSQKTSELANENDRLRISQAKLKALNKENTEEYKKITKTISDNSKQIKDNNAQMDALRKTIGITEMSTKQLSKRALELRRELSGMSQASDPERFNKLNKELIDTERQMRKNKAAIGETKEAVSPLIETAKGLLPAFGWAAIGAGAVSALNKIKDSTDTLATQWEVFMGGMNQATDEFFRTIATGDWSNFIGRMREAIEVGREYQETLDDLEEKSRALRIAEAESRAKELDLEIKLRNKTLSNEERRKAGEERIQIEKDMADKRTKLAQEAFDAELKKTMQESKLSEEQLKKVMRDFDSMDKEQAKIYLGMIDNRKKLQETMLMEGSTDYDLDKMKRLNAEIDAAPESIKLYAQAVAGQGRTTDEQLNKTTDAWVNLLGAQNSAIENIPRIITQVNSLLAAEEKLGEGSKDKAKTYEPRDKTQLREIPTISATQVSEDDILFASKKHSQEEWTKFLQKQVDKQLKIQKTALEEERAIEEARVELKSVVVDAVGQVAGALSDMFEQGSAAQIAFLAIEKAAAIAQIIFQTGIANAKAVAASPLTFGQPWVTINTVSAGASIASIVAQTIGQVSSKGKQSGGFSSTDGPDSEPDGVYHKNEFIASAPAVRNPTVRPILNIIDMAQRQGKIATLNLPAVLASMGAFTSGSRQSGGFASASPSSPSTPQFSFAGISDESVNKFAEAVDKLVKYRPSIDVKTFKEKFELIDEYENGGLK